MSCTLTLADVAAEGDVLSFLQERLAWYLREVRGGSYDVVNAVMATTPVDVRDAMARVDAVSARLVVPRILRRLVRRLSG